MSLIAYQFRPRVIKSFFYILKRELLLKITLFLPLILLFYVTQAFAQCILYYKFPKDIGYYNLNIYNMLFMLFIYINSLIRDFKNGFFRRLSLIGIYKSVIFFAKWTFSYLLFIPTYLISIALPYMLIPEGDNMYIREFFIFNIGLCIISLFMTFIIYALFKNTSKPC